MKPSEIVQKACQLLRRRVRLRSAALRLPSHSFPHDDTPAIREAMRLYRETWIVPILDAIESGDTQTLLAMTHHEIGEEIGSPD